MESIGIQVFFQPLTASWHKFKIPEWKSRKLVLHCSNLAFCTLLLLFFLNLPFCVGVTAITKTNYNQNCMPIASLEFPIPPSDMYPSAHIHINTHITHTHAHNHNGARTNTCICVKISLKNNDKHVPINYTPSKPYLLHLIQQACQLLFRFAILLILIGSLTWFFTIQHWTVVWNCWS